MNRIWCMMSHLDHIALFILQDSVDACHQHSINHQLAFQHTSPTATCNSLLRHWLVSITSKQGEC